MSSYGYNRSARIRELADQVNARMEDEGENTSGGDEASDESSSTEQPDKGKTRQRSTSSRDRSASKPTANSSGASDDATDESDDGDEPDWRARARKNDNRAKRAAAAAEKLAEEKSAADAAREEAEAKSQALLDSIAKAIGVKNDDADDPARSAEKLQASLAEHQGKVTALEQTVAAKDDEIAGRDRAIAAKDVELAAWKVAVKQGIDAATLMDLRSTERALAKLDPEDDDFDKHLEAFVKDAAKDNPALRVAREATATEAGIGAVGDRAAAAAAATPGTGRLRAAYST